MTRAKWICPVCQQPVDATAGPTMETNVYGIREKFHAKCWNEANRPAKKETSEDARETTTA